jgi:hypothetical protein
VIFQSPPNKVQLNTDKQKKITSFNGAYNSRISNREEKQNHISESDEEIDSKLNLTPQSIPGENKPEKVYLEPKMRDLKFHMGKL